MNALKVLQRAFALVLLGLLLVLPAVAGNSPGGDTSTGVWILPRSSSLGGGMIPTTITNPRGTTHYNGFSQPIQMKVSSEVINPIAFLVDPITNNQISLPVTGDTVTIPVSVLNGLAGAGVTQAMGSIVDANSRGYYFRLRIDPIARTADIDIY